MWIGGGWVGGGVNQPLTLPLLLPPHSSQCSMWLGAGIGLLRLDQLEEAEDALMEANVRNNKDPVVWGFVALVCLARGDKVRVDQADKAIVQVCV